jgi:hypothetical protein
MNETGTITGFVKRSEMFLTSTVVLAGKRK